MKLFKSILLSCLLAFSSAMYAAGPVDINQADAATIASSLKGIGPKKAEAIIEYRKKHGPFKNLSELMNVKGIGEKTLADNRDNLILK